MVIRTYHAYEVHQWFWSLEIHSYLLLVHVHSFSAIYLENTSDSTLYFVPFWAPAHMWHGFYAMEGMC